MKQNIHPIVAALQRAEKRTHDTADRLVERKAEEDEIRAERDRLIRDDPDTNLTHVGRRYGVSATWVRKVRATPLKEN